MRVITLADGVTTNQTGSSTQIIGSMREKFTAQFVITATITADLQGSMDGTNWQSLSSQSSSAEVQVDAFPYLRVVTTSAAGSPSATVKVGV